MYCELTGLTAAFIRAAPTAEILQACKNLNVNVVHKIDVKVVTIDFEKTREKLMDFFDSESLYVPDTM